jgi:hypothetical protein
MPLMTDWPQRRGHKIAPTIFLTYIITEYLLQVVQSVPKTVSTQDSQSSFESFDFTVATLATQFQFKEIEERFKSIVVDVNNKIHQEQV